MTSIASAGQLTRVLTTGLGKLSLGDARDFLRQLPDESVRLVVSSVWFTGPYEISSADPTDVRFSSWLDQFMREFDRILTPNGSVVLEMGCTWACDKPVRTVQNYAAIAGMLASGRWHLLQEFYWYNPELLYPRDEWVRQQRIRLHDSVSTWYWLARTPGVPADTSKIRKFESALTYPFGNLLAMGDSELDLAYLDQCAADGTGPHPDRLPVALPLYFISMLTSAGDHVVDPFVGIGSTALAAELTGRTWSCNDFDADSLQVARQRISAIAAPGRSAADGGDERNRQEGQ